MLPPVGHSTNLVGIPTGLLASPDFNAHSVRLSINGVREMYPALFRMLDDAPGPAEAMEAFQNFMRSVFVLEGGQPAANASDGRRHFRASYRRLLQGWGFDANGPEGAVLKGWVESRFGLLPVFHKEALGRYPSEAWMHYVEQKMSGRFHNNSIQSQLDLLYEYGQWMLARWLAPGRRHTTLYRGVNDLAEHAVIERLGTREAIVRQNNLVSFTARREVAETFGDTILEAQVPLVKVLFFNDLLPGTLLRGEGEYLVIGGDYRIRMSYL